MKVDIESSQKQYDAFNTLNDNDIEYLLFGGGANGGKTWMGWVWLIGLCYTYPQTRYFVGREELKRLKASTLITFFKIMNFYNIPKNDFNYNAQYGTIKHKNGSQIDLLDLKYLPSDPLYERYGSAEYTSGWIEEAGETHFDAFDTLKSRINRYSNDKYGIKGKLLLTCNPKKNWLYTTFYKPYQHHTLPDNMAFIQSLVTDNDFREEGSVEKLQGITNKAKRERLLFGNWDYEDEPDQLINYEWLDASLGVEHTKGNRVLGCDVARFGDDKSVIAQFDGNNFDYMKFYEGLRTNEFADKIITHASARHISADKIGVDVVGLGAGTVDSLFEKNWRVKEIISGAAAKKIINDEGYKFNNLRSQMWWYAREELRKGEIRVDKMNDLLFEDLTAPKYEISGDKEIKIESKKITKKRIGRSPDLGDAFVYANWIRKHRKNDNWIFA